MFAIVIPVALLRLRKLRREGTEKILAKVGATELLHLDPKAIFYGFASKGMVQPSKLGGVWGLSATTLHFESFDYGTAHVVVDIPLDRVSGVRVANSFAGMPQRVFGGLLIVAYQDETGKDDEIAWRLDDRETAEAKLRERTAADGAT